jgi:thiamine kinase-like enzyme
MLSDELESVVSRHVPGEGTLDIQRLSSGPVNEAYRVVRDGRAYVLRVAAANSHDLGLDRAWEARVLERAVAADLAPELTYCDPRRGILIARWVDGRSWSPADVRRQSNISRMAELLRRVHAMPMPTPARVMGPATWIDYYSGAAQQRIHRDPGARAAPGGTAAPSAAEALRAAAAARLAALAVLPSIDPVMCHGDLHTLNLVDRGHSLVLLDWEYAHAVDPLWDLAGWSANNDLDDELKHDLLANYAGRPPTGNEYARMQLLGWLYDYVCVLWSELYLNLHRDDRSGVAPRGADPKGGIAARAQLLAARLSASPARLGACP